jgi:cytochrome P450
MFHDPDFMPFAPNEAPTFRTSFTNYMQNWPPAAYREGFWSLAGLWPFVPRTIYLTDPQLIEEMLITRPEAFGRDIITVGALASRFNSDSLFFAEGVDWKWQRRALAPAFRHENLLRLTPIFAQCAKAQGDAWKNRPESEPVDVMQAMSRVTFSIIERAVLSGVGAFDREKYLAALSPTLGSISWLRMLALFGLPQWLPFPGSAKATRESLYLFDETAKIVEARRASGAGGHAMIDLLLSAKDPESDRVMTDSELVANLYGLMIAGHETSAVALGWSLWLLAKDQATQERLRAEVQAIAGNEAIGPETVESLQFAKQVIQEAMRLFPPFGALGRQPREDTTLGPHKVSKKEPIYVAIWCLHRHERLWDDPNAFDPDRFAPEKAKMRHRCAYMPFGAGPRVCIGMSFAMLEMAAILATLVRDFRFAPVPGHRIELSPAFATRAKGGLPLRVERL